MPQTHNAAFLEAVDAASRHEVLSSIASHYGISVQRAFDEVVAPDAEHLLDYMVEPHRSATYVLMQRHGLLGY
jgi:hypothetical protein